MRSPVDVTKLEAFMKEIGLLAKGPGKVYFTGGSTALMLGLREQTIDIDLKLDPEPLAIFEGIGRLKEKLSVSVELAAPDQFLPALTGWRERSIFIDRRGLVDFFHYDLYSQVLSKVLRGQGTDLADAKGFFYYGKLDAAFLGKLFRQVVPEMKRYPAIDVDSFRRNLDAFVRSLAP